MQDRIDDIRTDAGKEIEDISVPEELEALRIRYLGKKGKLTELLRSMGSCPPEERPAMGMKVNGLRSFLEERIAQKQQELQKKLLEKKLLSERIDVTVPAKTPEIGTIHPITAVRNELIEIFMSMGFDVAEGPEVETDHYNFEALNIPEDHPSRDMQDSFYITKNLLLRTQTSGVQVHVMEQQKPPIYIIAPGKVYRRDVADPSHLPQFTQIEGLVIDKGISFGDLKGTLDYFCKQMFGPDRKTRFRAHYFPFTEPSAEADVSCGVCGGTGHLHDGERCRMCKGTGWLEILGCGMVDPNVLSMSGIDPEEYSGFAFGVGVERVACLKYNVPDLRMLLEGDMRFLRQF